MATAGDQVNDSFFLAIGWTTPLHYNRDVFLLFYSFQLLGPDHHDTWDGNSGMQFYLSTYLPIYLSIFLPIFQT